MGRIRYSKGMPRLDTPPLVGLRRLRHRLALSQEDLSSIAHVSQTAISELENGQRTAQPRTIRRLAKALRVQPAELYA